MYYKYGAKEVNYLKDKDERLGEAIDKIGTIEREVDTDLFAALVHHIVGQQISTKAQNTIWDRFRLALGDITPRIIEAQSLERLQGFGITFRKATYIRDAALKILSGEFDIDSLSGLPDEEICRALSRLEGVGTWTAEMLMLFSMQRPNILSYSDLAIQRGMRMLYHHRKIDRKLFAKYWRRYSPHASVASLYLWAIAGGALPGMKDYAPKKTGRKK